MNGISPKLKVIPDSCGSPSVMQSLLQLSFFTSGIMFDCCCPGDLGKWQHMLASKSSVSQSHAGKEDEVCPQKPSATCGSPASSWTEIKPRNVLIMSWKESQHAFPLKIKKWNWWVCFFTVRQLKKWALKGFLGKLWRTFSQLPYRFYCHLLWLCSRGVTSVNWECCIKKLLAAYFNPCLLSVLLNCLKHVSF